MSNKWNMNYEAPATICREGCKNDDLCDNFAYTNSEQLGLPFGLYLEICKDEDAPVEILMKKGERKNKQRKDWILKWRHADGQRRDKLSHAAVNLMKKKSIRVVRREAVLFVKRIKESIDEDMMEFSNFPDKKYMQSKVDCWFF